MSHLAEELARLRADNDSKNADIKNLEIVVEEKVAVAGTSAALSRSQRIQQVEDQFSSPAEKRSMGFMVDLTFDFNASLKMAVEVLVLNPAQCSGMFVILLWISLSYCSLLPQ